MRFRETESGVPTSFGERSEEREAISKSESKLAKESNQIEESIVLEFAMEGDSVS